MSLEEAYAQVEKDYDTEHTLGYPCEVVRGSKEPTNDYYRKGGIEVIDFIKAKLTQEQYKGYLLGNIYKYSGRCQYKGEYEKDLVKLAQYTNWLLMEEDGRAALKEKHDFNT